MQGEWRKVVRNGEEWKRAGRRPEKGGGIGRIGNDLGERIKISETGFLLNRPSATSTNSIEPSLDPAGGGGLLITSWGYKLTIFIKI